MISDDYKRLADREARARLRYPEDDADLVRESKLIEHALRAASMTPDICASVGTMREALRSMSCPRPCNGRKADCSVGECFDAGECGCVAHAALTQAASQPAGNIRADASQRVADEAPMGARKGPQ